MPGRPPTRQSTPPVPEPRDGFVAVGLVRTPHGVRGEIKVEPLTDHPQRFRRGATVWAAGRPRVIRDAREQRGALLLRLDGIDSRQQAGRLRHTLLEVPEADLPPLDAGTYYRFQIVGLDVVDRDGRSLGRVEQVLETGANDVYVVRSDEGELLLPATDQVIRRVDLDAHRMEVDVIEGLERRPPTTRERPNQ